MSRKGQAVRMAGAIAAWLALFTPCFGEEQGRKVLQGFFPKAEVEASSSGLIDGKLHLAAILAGERMPPTSRIVVLAADENSRYRLIAGSRRWDAHVRWFDTAVAIRNDSVYFSLRGDGGCCSDYSVQYQFKPVDGQFVLVGQESSESGTDFRTPKDGDALHDREYISYRQGSSINYLSGEVVHWRVQGPSTSNEPVKDDIDRVRVGKKRVEKHFRFIPDRKLKLGDFDAADYRLDKRKHLEGYFDQDFKYHD